MKRDIDTSGLDVFLKAFLQGAPRQSANTGERYAAARVSRILSDLGAKPVYQRYIGAQSSYRPSALFFAGMLALAIIFILVPSLALVASILGALLLVMILRELSFKDNLLRRLSPFGSAENVWAEFEPSGEAKATVVLSAHIDAHRTPLIFSSANWVRFFQKIVPIGLGGAVSMVAVFFAGIFWPSPLLWLALLPGIAVGIAVSFLMVQADTTEFTEGANDNGSGVAALLLYAKWLLENPLENTRVVLLFSGAEETGCYGAREFAKEYSGSFPGAFWITIDSIAGQGGRLHYLTSEKFLVKIDSDRALIGLAEHVSTETGIQVLPHDYAGAYTDSALAAQHGFRVITLISLAADGATPTWHTPGDNQAAFNMPLAENGVRFGASLLQALDRCV